MSCHCNGCHGWHCNDSDAPPTFAVFAPRALTDGSAPRRSGDSVLRLAVWDWNLLGNDELLGYTDIDLEDRIFSNVRPRSPDHTITRSH